MGSHGGATAEGQVEILESFGITEKTMGCPIRSSMEVVELGYSSLGRRVVIDKNAYESDGIIVSCRLKPHNAFRGTHESGPCKMMTVGLGKQVGAQVVHSDGMGKIAQNIPTMAAVVLEKAPVLFAIPCIENAYDETCKIEAILPENILEREAELLKYAFSNMPKLIVGEGDVLVVDKIGKNISGDGMDPNISGRFVQPKYCSGGIEAEKVVILDLTDETRGNAQGVGLAEVTTRRLFNKMKLEMTYPTGVTNTFLHLMKIPMIMDNDREALQLALCCCPDAEDPENMKMIRIPDTAHIEYIEISEGLSPLAKANPHIEILSEPYELPFDEEGNLF